MVEFGINSTVAESTGKAPVELVYGTMLKSPIDVIVGSAGSSQEASNFVQHVKDLVEKAKMHMSRA